ncbi:hypothetical protein SAMN06297129_2172 [Pseudooceanicola antarcticus]|uniref:Uncharacterized protein n=1 Tax=Pseudooceanicola antarcticus TaxID=1247613 RepID=A0A285IWN3_9RHOB|nr:hypothetical protein [Pseudooceanicola antarcticus]SNY52087.1 hypothetical protein SAMN06297129_2172 [Pseudooceanicola antarcticus]
MKLHTYSGIVQSGAEDKQVSTGQRSSVLVLSFFLAATTTLFPNFSSAGTCIGYGKSKYGEASVADIKQFIFEGRGQTASGRLLNNGVRYFSNPISQLLLGVKSIDDKEFEVAIAHIDLASYLLWESNLCSRRDLEFFIFAARKFALEEGILSGFDRQVYLNFTTGLTNPSRELLSQDFQKIRQCLNGTSMDSDTGVLVFASC